MRKAAATDLSIIILGAFLKVNQVFRSYHRQAVLPEFLKSTVEVVMPLYPYSEKLHIVL